MYYTSTFAAAGSHLQTDSSQLIDAIAIAQNEIDVTSIDGNREITLWFEELSHAEAQRRRERKNAANTNRGKSSLIKN
jgi:hypothetical protein